MVIMSVALALPVSGDVLDGDLMFDFDRSVSGCCYGRLIRRSSR